MHDALRNTFVIEVEDLLAEVKVLKRGRPDAAHAERVLIVENGVPC